MKSLLRLAVIFPLFLAACSSLQEGSIQKEEIHLVKAGFHVLPADTAARKDLLARMPPYRLQSTSHQGTLIYRYADPKAGVIYAGGQPEYAAYQQITTRNKARRASNLAGMTSSNWQVTGPLVW